MLVIKSPYGGVARLQLDSHARENAFNMYLTLDHIVKTKRALYTFKTLTGAFSLTIMRLISEMMCGIQIIIQYSK